MAKLSSRLQVVAVALVATAFSNSCGPSARSDSQDIFQQDEGGGVNGNERRHKANQQEILWTISMGGCTGHLIAPEIMMTAAHCGPRTGARYTSGFALSNGGGNDITVTQVLETNPSLDYAILAIRWSGSYPTAQRFPASIAHQKSALKLALGSDKGDKVFTVGFPTDTSRRWGATYAEGEAKVERGAELVYNIGIINGNSGGGVWRKSDGMLVSLTNAGPNAFGQDGWRGNDVEDSQHWNHGVAMWHAYASSRTLQDVFPNGRNRFTPTPAASLFVALGQAGAVAGSYALGISAPLAATTIELCEAPSEAASCDGTSVITAERKRTQDDLAIFASSPVALRDTLTLLIVAKGADNAVMGTQRIRFGSKS